MVTKKFPLKNHDRANEILRSVSVSVPWYKFPCLKKLLLRGQFNACAMVKERCKERWRNAAENVGEKQQVKSYIHITTIRKMVFSDYTKYWIYYFNDGETVLRTYRDSGEAKAPNTSRRVFSKFLLKYKQIGTIARQVTRAWSSRCRQRRFLLCPVCLYYALYMHLSLQNTACHCWGKRGCCSGRGWFLPVHEVQADGWCW